MDITKILAEARQLLDFELQREVWTLPTKKAERMESYEARYDALVERLVVHARKYGGSPAAVPAAAEQQSDAMQGTAPAAPAQASAPAPYAAPGDLVDEFDSPAF